jgi:Holliday junction resolvasome RuvABC DNA-binding subunit
MRHKWAAARERSASHRAPAATEHLEARAVAEDRGVVPWLRQLGFSAAEGRRAAEACESLPDASLEERIRFALRLLAPPCRRIAPRPMTAT